MKIDPVLAIVFSDLFVNLSAGWLGAAFIVPVISKPPRKISFSLLTINISLAMLSLLIAYVLRKLQNL